MKPSLFAICLLSLLLRAVNLFAQGETQTNIYFDDDSFDVFKVKIDADAISKFKIVENKSALSHKAFISTISRGENYFIINASIEDSFCNPIGYYVNNYKPIRPINLKDGDGNFYLKPNGALLITANDILICESHLIATFSNVKIGIQSGPLLVDNGKINSQFNPLSKNKNIRCGVGISTNQRKEKFLVFCISKNPVSFYKLSQFFIVKTKCSNALCLESGNCIMGVPNSTNGFEEYPGIICNYLYFNVH